MRQREGSEDIRLLLAYLKPERAKLTALSGLLVVAMLAPVAGPVLLGTALDRALDGEPSGQLAPFAFAFLGLTLGSHLLRVLIAWWSVELAWRVGNRLRTDLARHTLGLDLEWHSKHRPGLLIERLDGDIDAIVRFSSTAVLALAGNAVLVAGTLVVSFAIDWRVGAATFAATVIALVVTLRVRPLAVSDREKEREVQAQLYGDLEERLGGLEDLKPNGAGGYAVHKLKEQSARWWRTSRRAALTDDGIYAFVAVAFTMGTLLTLGASIWFVRQGQLTLGGTLALVRLSQMTRQPLEHLAEQLSELHKAGAGARRAAALLATRSTVADGPGTPLPTGPLTVDFDGVDLVYANGYAALKDIELHLQPGTTLGVVGRTGSGKTTIARLLTRLWDPTGGVVRVGGVDLRRTADDALRQRVTMINQDVELLHASVRDNLTFYGAREATDRVLSDTLESVGLGRWAGALPNGLDTMLDGSALSAGEGQLLAFARVLLADPGLVVLDEPTSRLDPATEARLAAATERALRGRTAVIIAHRLATLDQVDEICVVDSGRIVEHGSRTSLLADHRSRYAELLRASAQVERQTS